MTATTCTCAAHWVIPPRAGRPGMAWIPSGDDGDLYLVTRRQWSVLLERQRPDEDGTQPAYVVRSDGRCSCPDATYRRERRGHCKHAEACRTLFGGQA